jgi:hypothetical protein
MKIFTLFILVLAISFSIFAEDASRDFSVSKMFTAAVQQQITSGPRIQIKKSFVVKPEPGVENGGGGIARNTQTGQFLLVWQKNELNADTHTLMGKILNPQGIPTPGELELNATNGFASLAYNPKTNEFLLVYDTLFVSETQKSSIFVQRLTAAGKTIGNAAAFATDPNIANSSPKVTFNPKTGGYTLLWGREDGMVGQLLTDKAEPDGPVVMIHKFTNPFFPPLDLEYQPSGNKLLVAYTVWANPDGTDSNNYYLATLDPLLKNVNQSNHAKINSIPVVRGNGVFWRASIAFLPDLTGMVFYVDNSNIKRRQIDVKGKLKGSSASAFNLPQKDIVMVGPSAAFSTNAKGTFGLLIGLKPMRNGGPDQTSNWAQVLNSKGLPVGTPVEFPANAGSLYTLPSKPADSSFRFVDFAGATARTDGGIVKVSLTVTVP